MVKSLLKRQKPVKRESGASSEEGLGVQKRYNSPSKLLAWIVELKPALNLLASKLAPIQVCRSAPLGSDLCFLTISGAPDEVTLWLLGDQVLWADGTCCPPGHAESCEPLLSQALMNLAWKAKLGRRGGEGGEGG